MSSQPLNQELSPEAGRGPGRGPRLRDPAIHPELRRALPHLKQSEILRVLEALARKGLVDSPEFDRWWVYTPRVRWVATDNGETAGPVISKEAAQALHRKETDIRSVLVRGGG